MPCPLQFTVCGRPSVLTVVSQSSSACIAPSTTRSGPITHSRAYRRVLRCGEFSSSTPVAPNAKCAKPVIPICVFSQFPKTLRVQRKHSSLSRFVYFTPTRARRIHAPFHAATECLSNQCKDLHGFKTFTTQRCILSTDSPTWLGASLRVNACGAAKRSLILEHTRFLKCCDTLGSS